ncbi:MAG TPA: CARDB domain-containing protein, partial [Myxococcaceae bacterium]
MLAIKAVRSATLFVAAVVLACAPAGSVPEELSSQHSALGGPDLRIQTVTAPPSALPNSAIQLPVTVCNVGDTAGSAPVRLLRSTDATITLSDTNIGTSPGVGTLSPGACATASMTANIPSGNGTFYLGAYVDPSNVLVEGNESNNATAATTTTIVGSKPDFILTSVSGPPVVLPGNSFSTTVTLCNQGTTAGTAPVTVYMSADSIITTADTQVGILSAPPTLAPGACATLTGNVTAMGISNTWWLG